MIGHVNQALGRIAAIQSTIGLRTGSVSPEGLTGASPGFKAMLAERIADPIGTAAASTEWPGAWPGAAGLPVGEISGTHHHEPGALSSGPPAGLEAYANGQIPIAALAPIGGGEALWRPAADAFNQMQADATAAGITLGVSDAYRPLADQERLAAELGLYGQGGWAAVPGTSQHGWGRAIDLDLDAPAQAWMREHGAQYGFRETVPNEPWHWEFHP